MGGAGLEVERLEAAACSVAEEIAEDHVEALRRYYEEAAEGGRTIWVSFDWAVLI